jgi:DnaD/phage-associated family protein
VKPTGGFAGFPAGKVPLTPIPGSFFSDLLPAIDHLGELKLTLYAFWALARREGRFRYLRREELAEDDLLMQGLRTPGVSAEQALDEALERAVARGTLLRVGAAQEASEQTYFFLNTPKGRAGAAALENGSWRPSGDPRMPVELRLERPNVFTLYEQNIGPLTPMIAEMLHDAETEYPEYWIEEAIQIAVRNNARKWSYIEAILKGWRVEGKDDREDRGDTQKALRRYLEGDSAEFFDL